MRDEITDKNETIFSNSSLQQAQIKTLLWLLQPAASYLSVSASNRPGASQGLEPVREDHVIRI